MNVNMAPIQLTEKRPQASSFVGRTAELDRLTRCFNATLQGERQLVFLSGPPGIGKTTLIDTFLEQVMATQPRLLSPTANTQYPTPFFNSQYLPPKPLIGRGQCIERYGTGEAYLPLLEALGRLGREPEGEEVVTVLEQFAPSWLKHLPNIVSAPERQLRRTLIGATHERMLGEIAEVLEELSWRRPLVLVLEDLHWSDLSTVEALTYLARRRGGARLFILGTYRPAETWASGNPLKGIVQELQSRGHCTELRLGLFNEAQVTEYLAARAEGEAPQAASLHPLAQVIHRWTEGNPLFMVTMVEQWIREGVIEKAAGQWRARADLANLKSATPDNLRRLIERQLERLSETEQRILEVASAVGTDFAVASVAAGLQTDCEEVETQCERLARTGQFLRAAGFAEWPDGTIGGRYRFLHALYQNVLCERITEARRIQLHRRIAERKETAYGAQAGEIAGELAVPFRAGRDSAKAMRYLKLAGERAPQHAGEEGEHATGNSSLASSVQRLALEELRRRVTGQTRNPRLGDPSLSDPRPKTLNGLAAPSPPLSAVFRHEGEYWTIAFDGVRFHVNDTFGMRYLASLLQRPHQAVHVRELAGEPRQSNTAEPTGDEGSCRLTTLEQQTLVSPSERARVNVTRAIKTAIKKLTLAHRALGVYLTATIKTGTTCSYSPTDSPSIIWQV